MLSGLVQHYYEDAKREPYETLERKLNMRKLYFNKG